jgi:hypothetical protein
LQRWIETHYTDYNKTIWAEAAMLEFYSDTQTKPTLAMREAALDAPFE